MVFLPGLAAPQEADQIASKRVELNSVRSKIAETNKSLDQTVRQQKNIQAELDNIDSQFTQLTAALIPIQNKIDQTKQRLKENTNLLNELRKTIEHQKKKLSDQLTSAYRAGTQDGLKLLLNQEDMTISNRMLVYHNYLTRERSQKVAQFNHDLERLAQLDTQLQKDNVDLSTALHQKQKDQAALQQLKNQRAALLNQLNSQYSVDQDTMHRLQNDEQQLKALLENLQHAEQQRIKAETLAKEEAAKIAREHAAKLLAERQKKMNSEAVHKSNQTQNNLSVNQIEKSPVNSNVEEIETSKPPPNIVDSSFMDQNLSLLKGRLSWPVNGKIINSFGSPRFDSYWEGVLMGASTGEKVHALANGRVVYAGWMRGFGMLIIVNHGKGYMSVYAFNESLFKNVGAVVREGEVIASVGQSGGQPLSALYFEIRLDGKPLDPGEWCK